MIVQVLDIKGTPFPGHYLTHSDSTGHILIKFRMGWDSGYPSSSTSKPLILFISDKQSPSHYHTTPVRALKLAKRQLPWVHCSTNHINLTLNCCSSAAQKILWSIMNDNLADLCTLYAICRCWLPWSRWLNQRRSCRKKCSLLSLFPYLW